MAKVPEFLIPALQQALVDQGFPSDTVKSDGAINPAGFLVGFYDTVEFRSSITPPILINTKGLLQESNPNPITQWLRPTVTLRGASGVTTIAPYGESTNGSPLPFIVAVLGVFAVGYIAGRLTA